MLLSSVARLISGIRSSHSRPSPWSCVVVVRAVRVVCAVRASSWAPRAAPAAASAGTSFMPHFGQVAGSEAVTSGCIGQA